MRPKRLFGKAAAAAIAASLVAAPLAAHADDGGGGGVSGPGGSDPWFKVYMWLSCGTALLYPVTNDSENLRAAARCSVVISAPHYSDLAMSYVPHTLIPPQTFFCGRAQLGRSRCVANRNCEK